MAAKTEVMPKIASIAVAIAVLVTAGSAFAQTPTQQPAQAPAQQPVQSSTGLSDQAKALIGSWEFSSADRERRCTATFSADRTAVGYRVTFDKDCATQFPLVATVAGWTFPEGDLLRFLDGQKKVLVEFSEVEMGIYEAPTPGVGVLFLQNAAAAGGPEQKSAQQMTGEWQILRAGTPICSLTLSPASVRDAFTLVVKSGCDPVVARQNFAQWKTDGNQLLLVSQRGNTTWRFEDAEDGSYRRLPEGAEQITMTRAGGGG